MRASSLLLAGACAALLCGRVRGQGTGRAVCANLTQAARRTVAVGPQGACALSDGGRTSCWSSTRTLAAVPLGAAAGASTIALTKDGSVAVAVVGASLVRWGGGGQPALTLASWTWTSSDIMRADPLPVAATGVAFATTGPFLRWSYSPPTGGYTTLYPVVVTAWVTSQGAVRLNTSGATCTPPVFTDAEGSVVNPSSSALTAVPANYSSGQAAVAVTTQFACALSLSGGVGCWGLWAACTSLYNASAQAFTYTPANGSAYPAPASVASGQVAITGGRVHACALSRNGSVTCWGPQAALAYVPPWVATGQVAVSAANDYTCAVSRAGAVQCWGSTTYDWDAVSMAYVSVLSPPASLPPDVVDVVTGVGEACALTAARRLYCWGRADRATAADGVSTAPDVVQGRIDLPCVQPDFAAFAPGASSPPPSSLPCGDAELRSLPGYDLVGTRLARLAVASEGDCRTACCAAPACAGYAFGAELLASAPTAPCALLSNVTQLVPSTIMNAGVRANGTAADAAAA
jgi:hypothetical protein